jgi:hypothetical protein
VYRSLEKYPYEKNFILTDTTTGDYWYNGPVIQTIYSRKLPLNFSLGLAFNYKVQMGLKNVYTKVESIQREIFPGLGLSWGVSEEKSQAEVKNRGLGLGFFVYPYDNKVRLTAVREMQDAVVYRQIGLFTRFRQVRGRYIRDYRTKGLLLGGQVFAALSPSVRMGLFHRTWAAGITTTDNLFVQRGYEQQIQNQTRARVTVRKSDWQASAQIDREAFDDWSKSLAYGCLYGEEARRRVTAGVGLGTANEAWPVTLGIEAYAGRFQRTYTDYLSHQGIDTSQPEWQVRAGMEIPLRTGNWRVRLGGNWGRQVPDLFYRYSRDKMWELTGGLVWRASHFQAILVGAFHSRLPEGSAFEVHQPLFNGSTYLPDGQRQRFTIRLVVQLWNK